MIISCVIETATVLTMHIIISNRWQISCCVSRNLQCTNWHRYVEVHRSQVHTHPRARARARAGDRAGAPVA